MMKTVYVWGCASGTVFALHSSTVQMAVYRLLTSKPQGGANKKHKGGRPSLQVLPCPERVQLAGQIMWPVSASM